MFQDKVVWITGASSGIGEAVALEMARNGAKLILSSRREDALVRVADAARAAGALDALVLPFDVTDEAGMPTVVGQAVAHYGRIDLLLNNAGIGQRSYCLDTDMITYHRIFAVDVFGQIALTKHVLPIMIRQSSGHIAIMASIAGKIGVPGRTAYCGAKHAVMGFFDSLRSEVRPHNIHVSCITPGFIKTPLSENALNGDGSLHGEMDDDINNGMDVTKAAKIMVRGLSRQKKEIIVSHVMEKTAALIKRLCPSLLFMIMEKQAEKDKFR